MSEPTPLDRIAPGARLAGVRAKLDRGREHLQMFHSEVSDWVNSDSHTLTIEHKGDPTEHFVSIAFDHPDDIPWLRWGCIYGDLIYALRSALDSLVYEVAVTANQGITPPPNETGLQFPIFGSPEEFAGTAGRGRGAGPMIRGLPDLAKQVIEELQPYHSWPQDATTVQKTLQPLWALGELANHDKHRRITISAFYPLHFGVEVTRCKGTVTAIRRFGDAIQGDADLMSFRFSEPNDTVGMKYEQTLSVAVKHPRTRPDVYSSAIETAKAIGAEVLNAVERLAQFV